MPEVMESPPPPPPPIEARWKMDDQGPLQLIYIYFRHNQCIYRVIYVSYENMLVFNDFATLPEGKKHCEMNSGSLLEGC